MKNTFKILLAMLFAGVVYSAQAGSANDLPSCYVLNKMAPPKVQDVEMFVLVDQTTPFDANLKKSILENTGRMLKPGTSFSVGSFSSFSQGRYVDILTSGTLELLLNEDARNDVGAKQLKAFDACMAKQRAGAGKVISAGFAKAFGGVSQNLVKSDVISSLKEFSNRIRQSTAKRKVVLVASDMLENSSVSSFYSKQSVRQIDPAKELELAKKSDLLGDFGGAEIYVIGAGLLAEDTKVSKGIYRSPQIMGALRSFWSQWFDQSKAKLEDFGSPALLNQIR